MIHCKLRSAYLPVFLVSACNQNLASILVLAKVCSRACPTSVSTPQKNHVNESFSTVIILMSIDSGPHEICSAVSFFYSLSGYTKDSLIFI
jgi:hypothetical protein